MVCAAVLRAGDRRRRCSGVPWRWQTSRLCSERRGGPDGGDSFVDFFLWRRGVTAGGDASVGDLQKRMLSSSYYVIKERGGISGCTRAKGEDQERRGVVESPWFARIRARTVEDMANFDKQFVRPSGAIRREKGEERRGAWGFIGEACMREGVGLRRRDQRWTACSEAVRGRESSERREMTCGPGRSVPGEGVWRAGPGRQRVEVRSSGTDSGLAIVGPQASSSAGPNGSPRLLLYIFFSFLFFLFMNSILFHNFCK
jgi:hypothetical protein